MVAELHAGDLRGAAVAPGWELTVEPNPATLAQAAGDADAVARTFLIRFVGIGSVAAFAAALVLLFVMRAEKLARERSQFAAAAAHELRTPLAGLQLYGDMLADGLGDPGKHARLRAPHERRRGQARPRRVQRARVLAARARQPQRRRSGRPARRSTPRARRTRHGPRSIEPARRSISTSHRSCARASIATRSHGSSATCSTTPRSTPAVPMTGRSGSRPSIAATSSRSPSRITAPASRTRRSCSARSRAVCPTTPVPPVSALDSPCRSRSLARWAASCCTSRATAAARRSCCNFAAPDPRAPHLFEGEGHVHQPAFTLNLQRHGCARLE